MLDALDIPAYDLLRRGTSFATKGISLLHVDSGKSPGALFRLSVLPLVPGLKVPADSESTAIGGKQSRDLDILLSLGLFMILPFSSAPMSRPSCTGGKARQVFLSVVECFLSIVEFFLH